MDANNTYILPEEHNRTARVIGISGLQRLEDAHVAVFGVGGVGGHCVEALARAGVGHLTIVDGDEVSLSNINRQAVALHSTLGRPKVEVMAERIKDINPACEITSLHMFYLPETAGCRETDLDSFDYVADCVDSVVAKIHLAVLCHKFDTPLISAMAAGNKLYPERFVVTDVFKTNTDPLAKVMRRELKARGIPKLKVVCSDEVPAPVAQDAGQEITRDDPRARPAPGCLSFTPAAMGLIMAGEIIRSLSGIEETMKAAEEAKRAEEKAKREAEAEARIKKTERYYR
ncbi:MAG: tRNA threonylcarbamoyladenosine dehydratase [Clostridia bacterium]|nr:tRNA threonylcarbamoyladenosine dehydratase [Clostridia bacterium]